MWFCLSNKVFPVTSAYWQILPCLTWNWVRHFYWMPANVCEPFQCNTKSQMCPQKVETLWASTTRRDSQHLEWKRGLNERLFYAQRLKLLRAHSWSDWLWMQMFKDGSSIFWIGWMLAESLLLTSVLTSDFILWSGLSMVIPDLLSSPDFLIFCCYFPWPSLRRLLQRRLLGQECDDSYGARRRQLLAWAFHLGWFSLVGSSYIFWILKNWIFSFWCFSLPLLSHICCMIFIILLHFNLCCPRNLLITWHT